MPEHDDVTPLPGGEEQVPDPAFARLLDKLSTAYNFDFREYKTASLVRRIRARTQQVRAETFDAYIEYLDGHPGEHVSLFNTILINVTTFFRDPEAWKVLVDTVIPRLIADAAESRSVRVWSAGCSSGEEAYSIAMLMAEHLGDREAHFNVKIYATDVDEDALAHARQALYRGEDLKEVPNELLDRYFVREGQAYRFRREYRRWCIFGRHNVAQDPPLSHVDLLVCRNVLIYFTSDLQERILSRFHYAVREGGFLFLGRSESMLARSRWFVPRQLKWRIFERATVASSVANPRGDAVPAAAVAPRGEAINAPRMNRIMDALPTALMVVDLNDTILLWNAAAEALYDIPSEHAVGHKFRDLDVSYRIEGLRARIEEVKTSQATGRLEDGTFTRRSGDLVHADISIVPVIEAQRVVAVTVVAVDATEHARLRAQMTRVAEQHATANEELQSTNEELETTNEELQSTNEELETTIEELQAANAELATLNAELEQRTTELNRLEAFRSGVLNSLEQPVVVLDRQLVVTGWNKMAERVWGLSAEHAIGHPFASLPLPGVAGATDRVLARVLASGRAESIREMPIMLPGGEPRGVPARAVPFRGADGHAQGVVVLGFPEGTGG